MHLLLVLLIIAIVIGSSTSVGRGFFLVVKIGVVFLLLWAFAVVFLVLTVVAGYEYVLRR